MSNNSLQVELPFSEIPLWTGVSRSQKNTDVAPFLLVIDEQGFLRQTTSGSTVKSVVAHYQDPDYQFITPPPGYSDWANRLGDELVAYALPVILKSQAKRVVEIGAGSTYVANQILDKTKLETYRIYDPAIETSDNDNQNIECISSYFSGECVGDDFDVVTCFNCLEHVPDPLDFLINIRKLIEKNNGLAVFIFPDVERQLKIGDLNVLLHEHINYFTHDSVVRLFLIAGLAVENMERNKDELSFTLSVKNSKVENENELKNVFDLDIGNNFINSINSAKKRVRMLIESDVAFSFYGATNGLNTFGYLMENEDLGPISIFDGDKSKVGSYLPFLPAEIGLFDDKGSEHIDSFLISAMTYYNEIRQDIFEARGPQVQIEPLFQA